jgi:hypothetical protein
VVIEVFYNSQHLLLALGGAEPEQTQVARSDISKVFDCLRDRGLTILLPIQQWLAEQEEGGEGGEGALCVLSLDMFINPWSFALVALPHGTSAEQVMGDMPDGSPIKPLTEREPMCGLLLYQLHRRLRCGR